MSQKSKEDKELIAIFNNELADLRDNLIKMSKMVRISLEKAVQSLVNKDWEMAQQVIDGDEIVDRMELDIEEQCLQLIALKHPVSKKLRVITSAMKAISDLERVGDRAANIAGASQYLSSKPMVKPLVDIPRMADLTKEMLKDSLEAYLSGNVELAKAVWEKDKLVDQINQQILRELLTFMLEDPHTISRAIHLIFISDNLERIGDHAGNLAERVVYIVDGERIKEKFGQMRGDS
ncbi:MAG: phosphate signaling complex protein PhoU [Atribacterota bacterium]|jgi:phosphate transport system protein|nr:phosphate signaling complex protein PhoU [Atribacterota bacterium]MDD3031346.1 phosphate signaling complex protein PhoU [Atribacterota bacterium]MDD3640552.1 phosphate signaling complex protein PhoU [Atribacterota bacterium]MDD4288038.1 phosphate signaling complex protein PhoU [Atribacterota bacterium]MDD4764451.1 phosphate signaling complex protein PhoU [Atribacterota bacterium]